MGVQPISDIGKDHMRCLLLELVNQRRRPKSHFVFRARTVASKAVASIAVASIPVASIVVASIAVASIPVASIAVAS